MRNERETLVLRIQSARCQGRHVDSRSLVEAAYVAEPFSVPDWEFRPIQYIADQLFQIETHYRIIWRIDFAQVEALGERYQRIKGRGDGGVPRRIAQ